MIRCEAKGETKGKEDIRDDTQELGERSTHFKMWVGFSGLPAVIIIILLQFKLGLQKFI